MKKSFLFLAVCAAALTACTSEEVIEEGVQSNVIGFQNVVSKNSRAISSKDDLKTFYAYAYYTTEGQEANPISVFSGEPVTLKDDGTWGYTNTRYWVPDGKYYFYAYSCENKAIASAYGTPSMNLDAVGVNGCALRINEFICNNTHQDDLVFATNENMVGGAKGKNEKVAFTFQHILTKVNVVFSSGFAPGYNIEISNVKICNIRDKGSYNSKATNPWGTPTRILKEGDEDYVPYIDLSVPSNAKATAAKPAVPAVGTEPAVPAQPAVNVTTGDGFVLPFAYSQADVRLQFEVNITNANGESILNRTLTGEWKPNWVVGTAYTYNVKITGSTADLDPIVFETSEDMNLGWGAGDTNEVKMTFSAN